MIELKEGMSVMTPGGEEVGRVNRFVLDPETNEVTHIVVQKGWLLQEDKVVPFEMVTLMDRDRVGLKEEVGDFDSLPTFEEINYIQAVDDNPNQPAPVIPYTPSYYWYPSLTMSVPGAGMGYYPWMPTETKRNIPEGTVPIKEGTDVISSDGEHVGDVERLIVAPDSNRATHFVISQGLLFKERKMVPAHWVKTAEEDKVYLVVPARLLERLPAFEE